MPLTAYRNMFAGSPLDRHSGRRKDSNWLEAQVERPETRIYALWNGTVLVEGEPPKLAAVKSDLAHRLGGDASRLLFLGCDDDAAVFALDLEGSVDPAVTVGGSSRFQGLRELAPLLAPGEASVAATARAMFEWGGRTRFCPACGAPLTVADGGWRRTCTVCGVDQFPRTDPVVIMLPVRGDHCLLGRQASWAQGRYSALAGFMEPGESIEEACAREIAEETGLCVSAVAYHSSQPWPFPTNLMIGLFAEVDAGEAGPVDGELEAVRWVSRDELRTLLATQHNDQAVAAAISPDPISSLPPDALSLPPPLAIARRLIEVWAHDARPPTALEGRGNIG